MLGTTPRLLPCLRTARIAQLGRFRLASTQQLENKEVWKEINRLASAGKWDNLNNMPEMFIRGKDKQDAYAAFQKINTKTGVFEQSPGAAVFGFLFRPFCAAVLIYLLCKTYEIVAPEEYRLAYKYRKKHDHGEHGHGAEHH